MNDHPRRRLALAARWGAASLGIGAVLAATLLLSARAPRHAGAQGGSSILFTASAGADSDLFAVDPEGGSRRNISRSRDTSEAQGDWSPDGSSVAHAAFSDGLWRIGIIDVDTGQQRTVTTGPEDLEPDWSPDSSQLLFTAYFNRGTPNQASFLMTVPPSGGPARPLIALHDPRLYIGNPHWSPDGTRIAFVVAGPSDGGELYVTSGDGTGARRLLSHPGWDDIDPAWSPSGTHIAFASGPYRGTTESTRHDIWLLDVELGVAGTVVVHETLDLRRPAWSPDGRTLVIDARAPSGGHSLHTVPALGGSIGTAIADGAEPDWSGGLAPTPTLPSLPTATPTPSTPVSPTPPLTASPPPATDFPPVPTLPPFPTMPPAEPTEPGPAPTFPRPTATATRAAEPSPSASGMPTTEATPTPLPSSAAYLPAVVRSASVGGPTR